MKLRLILFLCLLLAAPAAHAIDFVSGANYVLPASAMTTNELWLQARTITVSGTAREDCFLLADSVNQNPATNIATLRLQGTFQGDAWGAGDVAILSGTVAGHARLAAVKTIYMTGHVAHNLMALAPAITLASNATVGGSALLVGQDVVLGGTFEGDTRVIATKVTLAGNFGGTLNITADDITVMPGTRIAGNLLYRMEPVLLVPQPQHFS